ncbi:HNH endonuclease signature motif containing protein [Bacillus licheniformis]|nr:MULTISPECIES: HNH endonuclease signature motif containing protein [Bacillus]ARC58673.1 HNH endonuclease [Bacillus licheniformis]AVI45298.1 hypothetical protein BL14DL4_00029 [Bacillus licheniformis]AVI49612.1 hypothetical protein BL14DL4_04477 [Bacillus licheniformis]EFV72393.1 hypothetical protein HMPREF1012_01110 [Bacillus sp. BT1B_CT2]MCU9959372.1 hypothetical protein [Bacillus licheniformis]
MKKFVQSLLLSLLVLVALFGFEALGAKAASTDKEDGVTSVSKEILKFEVDKNKNAKLVDIEEGNTEKQIEKADQISKNFNHDYLYHSDFSAVKNNTVNLYPSEQKKTSSHKTQGKVPGFVEVQVETLLKEKTRTVTTVIKIVRVMGEKPVYINASHDLFASRYYNGKYVKVLDHKKKFTLIEIKPGAASSKSFKVGAASYYKREYSATVVWKDSPPSFDAQTSSPFLANKIANLYPYVKNSHNKEVMGAPADAQMKVVPEDQREKRDSNLRNKFITWYTKQYGNPKWNWSDYEIHHVIPLQYGGSNHMSNLFPLQKDVHKKVTRWWRNK